MGTAYSPVGPWNDSAPPAISPGFLTALEAFLVSLNSSTYDSNITSDQSGNITIPNTAHFEIAGFQIMWAPSSQDLYINCPNVGGNHKIFFQVGGVNKMSLDASGNLRIAGTLTQNTTP